MANTTITHSVSVGSIFKVVLVLISMLFVWYIRDIMALLFVSLTIASALDTPIDFLERHRIPRALSTILIYLIAISIIGSVLGALAGPIVTEVKSIASDIPKYYADIDSSINTFFQNTPSVFSDARVQTFKGGLDEFIANLSRIASGNILPVISALFGGLLSLMLALVITFYFIVQEGAVRQFLLWVIPKDKAHQTTVIIEKIQKKLGLWLRGQLFLSLIIFTITWIGLTLLGVKYALVLALLAGLFEMIPYLGPILSAIPAIFLTLVAPEWGGMIKASLVLILYIIIQQAENHLIVPNVMSKTVGLDPLIVIFSMLIGAQMAGIVGLIIAVPIATGITVYLKEMGYIRGEEEKSPS